MIDEIIKKITPYIERSYFNRFFNWFIRKLDLQDKAEKLDKKKNKGKHPIQPRKGDIYLIECGQNIGKELSNTHMGIIVQASSNNVASHTVLVVPISSSLKLYPTHERIQKEDIKTGKLDKLPSKAKGDQLTCIDKARMLYKIGSVTDDFMQRLEKRIMKNLDIKIPKKEEKQEKKEIKNNENVSHEDINKKSENKEETNIENTNKKAQSEEVRTDKK